MIFYPGIHDFLTFFLLCSSFILYPYAGCLQSAIQSH